VDQLRWCNLSAARQAFAGRLETAGEAPLEAFLEVSARCNLRCVMCAINVDRRYRSDSGRPAILEPALFATLRPAFPALLRAYLFGLGEPLLNPHLTAYAGSLAAAGAEVWFNTNGTLIDDAVAEGLARAGVAAVTVSMDGATAVTYEAIRRGAGFNAVLRGIRALVAARNRHGRPEVDLSFVAMAANLAELPDLVALCAREGIASIHVEPLFAQQGDELGELYREQNLGRLGRDRASAFFAEAARRGRELGVRVGSRLLAGVDDYDYLHHAASRQPWWRCSEPWTSVWVTAAGEVRCCCLNDTSFGSLARDSLSAIWDGAAFRAFRRAHAEGDLPASCSNCRRNARLRMSPYFEAVEPVTYRPLLDPRLPPPEAGGPTITWPAEGEVVTDPLAVLGRLPARWQRRARDLELMVDATPVAQLAAAAVVDGRDFALAVPVPYLSEGAHLLWLRSRSSEHHSGWARRTVHFWRPVRGPDALAADLLVLPLALPRRAGRPRILVDGAPAACRWLRGGRIRGRHGAAVLDTSGLAPGEHVLRAEVRGRPPAERSVLRIPRSTAASALP
jgi:MoaA/NifB/PqqE/SkfB family radical SAM enzyme